MPLQNKTLREHRQAIGLLQVDVACTLNVSNGFISNLERGISKVPLKRFRQFCEAYQISVESLAYAIKQDRDMELDRIVAKAKGIR